MDHRLLANLNKHFIHIPRISFRLLDCFPLLLQIALFGVALFDLTGKRNVVMPIAALLFALIAD